MINKIGLFAMMYPNYSLLKALRLGKKTGMNGITTFFNRALWFMENFYIQ